MPATRDTIFALSSGRPPAAIAVVRVSGPRAGAALAALTGSLADTSLALRRARLARLRDPDSGEALDEALVLWFPGPRSETGEDVAELQLHGGRAVVAAVLAALARIDGLRPAEPGEFSRRAFENGKLDLTAAEGLADLIGAETQAQRRQAFHHLKGLLGDRAERWRGRLVEALALVEAGIDFSDEADVPGELLVPALAIARELAVEIEAALAGAARGERLREGLHVAIAGPPNAGKSTLLNRIARREAAIVSPIPGTTRDAIEVHLDLEGFPVTLVDTAGIRESDDPIEQEGVRRARARAAAADLVLWVVDAAEARGSVPGDEALGLGCAAPGIAEAVPGGIVGRDEGSEVTGVEPPVWLLCNKVDLLEEVRKNEFETSDYLAVSAASGEGVNELLGRMATFAESWFGTGEPALVTRERHRNTLNRVLSALKRAISENSCGREDIIAEELRLAASDLGRLTGRVDVEDILDSIFRNFCIGK